VDVIPHIKRLEVARCYLLGSTYAEIEEKTSVSHGSVANIIKEFETGKLTVPGVASDRVDDLRQLSFELAKKGMEPAQALLGITLFQRFTDSGVVPSEVDQWCELVKLFCSEGLPPKKFFEAALKLHQLEEAEGKPFKALSQEYDSLKQKTAVLGSEVDSLDKEKKKLAGEVESLASELNTRTAELEEVKVTLAQDKKERDQLKEDIEGLKKVKANLGSEVDGREKSLKAIKELGFSEEDLLQLRDLLDSMAKGGAVDAAQVKNKFFSALDHFEELSGLEKATKEEAKSLQEMLEKKSLFVGEITELENRRAVVQGEIHDNASAGAEQIRNASKEAVSIIRREADAIRDQLKSILEDTLAAGEAVGVMRVMQKTGEEAGQQLEELVGEVERRLGEGR
jgi:chromosome segregation ATPase